jgi:hypothetical protein
MMSSILNDATTDSPESKNSTVFPLLPIIHQNPTYFAGFAKVKVVAPVCCHTKPESATPIAGSLLPVLVPA